MAIGMDVYEIHEMGSNTATTMTLSHFASKGRFRSTLT
jgi:hypothetical protein